VTTSTFSAHARPVSTVEATANALRHAIATRRYPPGTRIKEIPVAAELGLSRGPVRDALRVLAEEGLITLAANQGATVADVEADDLMELYALRLAFGTLALRRIPAGDQLTEPRTHLNALRSAVRQRRPAAAVEADLELQDALVRSAGLTRTARMFEKTTVQLRVYVGVLDLDFRPLLPAMHAEDDDLIAAVASGDTTKAVEAWRGKLEGWARTFIRHHGDDFDGHAWLALYGDH
jgi:DNA-binding GntR family transcriptional regulator